MSKQSVIATVNRRRTVFYVILSLFSITFFVWYLFMANSGVVDRYGLQNNLQAKLLFGLVLPIVTYMGLFYGNILFSGQRNLLVIEGDYLMIFHHFGKPYALHKNNIEAVDVVSNGGRYSRSTSLSLVIKQDTFDEYLKSRSFFGRLVYGLNKLFPKHSYKIVMANISNEPIQEIIKKVKLWSVT